MKRLTIVKGNKSINLDVESKKFLLGNCEIKYEILKCLKLFFSKEKSEFRKENNEEISILVNERKIDLKRSRFFYVDDQYSIIEDSKLSTKSLMTKYYEIKYAKEEYFEMVNTLNILLESFEEELNENSELKVKLNPFIAKQLLKISKPEIIDEFQKDEYDFSQEELILFQLKLIQYIQKNNTEFETTIIYVRTPKITNKIQEQIDRIQNSIILIETNFYDQNMNINEILLCEKMILDLNDENTLYYLISQEINYRCTLEEVNTMIKKYIIEKYTNSNTGLLNTIKKLSPYNH